MQIDIQNATKKLSDRLVLDHISLHMESGNIYGLKGRNGSGKTMLMRAISGLIRLDEGVIQIDGEILRKDITFPRNIGVLIESPGFINEYSAYKNLEVLTSIKNIVSDREIKATLELVGLSPEDKRPFRKFSLGTKQKLGIAAAIVESPELIILDEPTNALDESSILKLKEILKKLKDDGHLIILSCHDTEDLIEIADVIIELTDGRVSSQWSTEK